MSETAVLELEGVWKRHRRWLLRPESLKETLIKKLKGVRPEYDDFWALADFSLAVRQGEAVGFCGANGAGKSTLLKLIAGIEPPTHGTIRLRGRLATLLELGAGFLPDLTGRENIVLNGAILGLSDGDLEHKMATIVDFAGLGAAIDSPVRTYSSGMYMRLGFSIAAHVDADLMLVDEVLAVGDVAFQQRCADWLVEARGRGTAIVVVSHDLGVLTRSCDRVAWLDQGRVVAFGEPAEIVERYARAQGRHAPAGEPV